MSNKKLTPNQQALEIMAQLIEKTNGAGYFKSLRDLDVVRSSFTQIHNELNRLADLDKKGDKTVSNGSAGKSK